MKTKDFIRSAFYLPLLIFLVLITGANAQPGLGGVSGSQPLLLPSAEDGKTPAGTTEAQALRDGYELVPSGEQVLGDTGNPGLEGASGSQPLFLPSAEDRKPPASTSEAQALMDGYELVPSGEQVVGDTGNPGLEGASGSQPRFLPALQQGEVTSTTKEN
jgi:hypothetical protein